MVNQILHGGKRRDLLVCVALVCVMLFGFSCVAPSPYTREKTPRADQARWVDEGQVINEVVSHVNAAAFASSKKATVQKYADMLRYWYSFVSQMEEDPDAGIRALNFIHEVHRKAKGKKNLWLEAIEQAKMGASKYDSRPGCPIPQDYQ